MKNNFCIKVPELLLPAEGIDLNKWAVVACDQYTSEPEYWEKLDTFAGDAPSTLRCVFPEVWLGKGDELRIGEINRYIDQYLRKNVFRTSKGFALVERVAEGRRRLGLMAAVDLEAYSFRAEDRALIRATEGTILSRIPPRVRIREHAKVEFPHIMLLADDRRNELFGKLDGEKSGFELLYDFELNGNGGHLRGWRVGDSDSVLSAFEKLLEPSELRAKYGAEEQMLFAVGDGNHSLATAKTCWDNLKGALSASEREDHPARFALVEIVNIHDGGLRFEPIHRVLKNCDITAFAARLESALAGTEGGSVKLLIKAGERKLTAPADTAECYRIVQNAIDAFLSELGGEVDYIHGEGSLKSVTAACGGIGIAMPALGKEDLFSYVIKKGALPRKTFSMGEANEKRYYLEGRKLVR